MGWDITCLVFTNPAALLPPCGVACGRKGTARAAAGGVCGKGTNASLALHAPGLVQELCLFLGVEVEHGGGGVQRCLAY